MHLVVGTKSTWSLRAWICAQIVNLKPELTVVDLQAEGYKSKLLELSPTGLVPCLRNGDVAIHDSVAIAEFFNEKFDGALYPQDEYKRALARSLVAEMHSGFMTLRSECPFSTEPLAPLTDIGASMKAELVRVESIFEQASLPFMFEKAGAVDAFYSILAYRLNSYGIQLSGKAGEYQQALLNWDLLQIAIEQAKTWRA